MMTWVAALAIFTALVLSGALGWLFVQSGRNNQRAIQFSARMLLPTLSIILLTYTTINPLGQPNCSTGFQTVFVVGLVLSVVLILFGLIRYLISPNRDLRHVTQPVLLVTIIAILLFLLAFFIRCRPL